MMEDIRDIKGVIGVFDWGSLLFLILVAIIAAGLIFYIVKRLKLRKRKGAKEKIKKKIAKPFDQEAREALLALDPVKYFEQGQVKEYYFIMTEIVRIFLGRNYHIDTYDKTSLEIVEQLERTERIFDKVKMVETYFQSCDLIKFAKFRPGLPEMKEAKEEALKIIKECSR